MDDPLFDKKLADKLNTLEDYPVPAGGWATVEQRLRPTRSYSHLVWLAWLLLLIGNGWWAYRWHTTQQQYDELLQATRVLRSPGEPTVTTTDTVYQHIVTHHYDTVYRTVYHQSSPQFAADTHQLDIRQEKDVERQGKENGFTEVGSSEKVTSSATERDRRLQQAEASERTDRSSTSERPPAPADTSAQAEEPPVTVPDTAQTQEKKKLALHLHDFRIGPVLQLPLLTIDPQVSQGEGWGGGLALRWSLTERLRLLGTVQYQRTRYEVTQVSEALGIPDVLNGSAYQNDELIAVESRQSYVPWGGGVQYALAPQSKWNPFGSLRFLTESPLRRQLSYSLREATTGKVYTQEAEAPVRSWPVLEGELGVEYPASYGSSWQFAGFYNAQLGSRVPVRPNQIGVRARFLYRIKK